MWQQLSAEDAVAGGYASAGSNEYTNFETYLAHVRKE
jgi:hypothetical protein